MNYNLVSSILKGVWAMDEFSALSFAPLLTDIFSASSNTVEFDQETFKVSSYQRSTSAFSSWDGFANVPKGSIAIIPLSGPLMKSDQLCGNRGMASIGNIIKEADHNDNIDGIILKIDSPGGSVDGTAALAEIVGNTNKPIVAFADGLIASAALWIGASANEIIAATNKTQIGSVGVLLSFTDVQPALEKLGVKFHQIVADQSKDKTEFSDKLKAGNYDSYKQEVLNPIAQDFIAHMKTTRPGTLDKHLTGKLFFAQDVIGSLVDSIGNFDFAIARMTEIIDSKSENSNSNLNNTSMSKFKNINAIVGAELQISDGGAFLNAEQLEAVNKALAAKEEKKETTSKEEVKKETASETIPADTKKETAIDPKDKIIADLKEQVSALNSAATSDKEVVKSTDSNKTSNPSNDFVDAVAAAQELNDLIDTFN